MFALRFNFADLLQRRLLTGPYLTYAEAKKDAERLNFQAIAGGSLGFVILDRTAVLALAQAEVGPGPAGEMLGLMDRAALPREGPGDETPPSATPNGHNAPPPPAADPRVRELFKKMADEGQPDCTDEVKVRLAEQVAANAAAAATLPLCPAFQPTWGGPILTDAQIRELDDHIRDNGLPTPKELAAEVRREEVDAEMRAEIAADEEFGTGRGPDDYEDGLTISPEDEVAQARLRSYDQFYGSPLDPN